MTTLTREEMEKFAQDQEAQNAAFAGQTNPVSADDVSVDQTSAKAADVAQDSNHNGLTILYNVVSSSMNSVKKIGNQYDPDFSKNVDLALANPKFQQYGIKKMLSGDAGGLGDLLSEDKLKAMLDSNPAAGPAMSELFRQIGTNDMYKTDKGFETLDKLGDEIKKLAELQTAVTSEKDEKKRKELQDKMAAQQMALIPYLRDAGVDIPDDDIQQKIALDLFKNIVATGDVKLSLQMMITDLAATGMDPEALKKLHDNMMPLAGFGQFVADPYIKFFRNHGATLQAGIGGLVEDASYISDAFGGKGYTFNKTTASANVKEMQDYMAEKNNPQATEKAATTTAEQTQDHASWNGHANTVQVAYTDISFQGAATGSESKITMDDRNTTRQQFAFAHDNIAARTVEQAPAWVQQQANRNFGMSLSA